MRTVATISAAVALACAEPPPAFVTSSDSAGVAITTVLEIPPVRDRDARWDLILHGEIPGGGHTEHAAPLLYDPQHAVMLNDGRVAIHDAGPDRLLIVDPRSPEFAVRFAPTGRGPGEIYAQTVTLVPSSDSSLDVIEFWGNVRIHRFRLDGSLITDLPLDRLGSGWGPPHSYNNEVIYQVFTSEVSGTPRPDQYTDSLVAVDLRTGASRGVLELPARVPFPPGPRPVFHPNQMWSALGDGTIITGMTNSGVFRVFDWSGGLLREIRTPLTANELTEEDRLRARRMLAEYGLGSSEREIQFHTHNPVGIRIESIGDTLFAIVQRGGALRESDSEEGDISEAWRVFGRSGHPAGVIVFPNDFTPWKTSGEYLLGVSRDSLGVGSVRVYRLRQPVKR